MDSRIDFFQSLIKDPSKRILELGPLNRPIADKKIYPNAFYCDIRSTEEVRKLYLGNDYLEATGIVVNPETIVPIDYIVTENYNETFKSTEKFDYVIASHVLEHMEDLIFSLRDISAILKPGGIFCIVYPDKRYCFDHFRTSASFRDAYGVFRNGGINNASMVLDFYYSVIPENNPYVFWNQDNILEHLPKGSYTNAVKHYEQALKGIKMDDVHYWPFTDMDFLKFLYDCIRAKLLPFSCISFQPCKQNDQQFMVALQYDLSVLSNPEHALDKIQIWMEDTLPDYYSTKNIKISEENKKLQISIEKQNEKLNELTQTIKSLQKQLNESNDSLALQKNIINDLNLQIKTEIKIMHEQEKAIKSLEQNKIHLIEEVQCNLKQLELITSSTTWQATKPLRILADKFKCLLHINKCS